MQKKNKKASKIVNTIFKVGVICVYLCLIAVLIWQALTPGSQSSDISNNVGDKIDEIVTEIQKPTVEEVKVESVRIVSLTASGQTYSGENLSLSLGSVAKIKCEVLPSNATDPALSYLSSDEDILKTYSDGKVEAIAVGSATLTVVSQENSNLKSSVLINVINVPIKNFTVGNVAEEIQVGQSHRLEISYSPTNTSEKGLKYTSSDKSVLTVSSSGVLKGIKEGVATVTVTSTANEELTYSLTVNVIPKVEIPEIPVEKVDIKADSVIGYIGYTTKLTATFLPTGAKDSLVWHSSNEDIATVSQSGVVTCLKAGEVTVTVECANYQISNSIVITVKEVLSKNITLLTENLIENGNGEYSIKQGESGKIEAILSEDATVLTVTYSSSDPTVAQINSDGVIEAKKGGTVIITASTSYDGETTAQSIKLTVNKITFSDTMQNFYYWVRKSFGHFGAFLLLGIFAALTYNILFSKNIKGKIWGFLVCAFAGFAVAGITEILQLPIFTAGRTCSFSDVLLDFRGYCISSITIYFVYFVITVIKLIIEKSKAKKEQK